MQRQNDAKTKNINLEQQLSASEKEYEALVDDVQLTFDWSSQATLRNSDEREAHQQKVSASMRKMGADLDAIRKAIVGVLSNSLSSRILRLEIKWQALNFRWVHFSVAGKALVREKNVQKSIAGLLMEFVNGAKWFQCQDDMQCQRALYMLYTLLSTVPQTTFDTNQFLLTLRDKCSANFIRLMTIQALAVEKLSSNKLDTLGIKVITAQQLGFMQAFQLFQASADRAKSLQQQVELAASHFVAYRFNLACFHLTTKKWNPQDPILYAMRDREGLNERFVYFLISTVRNFSSLAKFMDKENSLRATHLEPALKSLEALEAFSRDAFARDNPLQRFYVFAVEDAWLQLRSMNHFFATLLIRCNNGETKFEPHQIKAISNYCEKLSKSNDAWESLYKRTLEYVKLNTAAEQEYSGKATISAEIAQREKTVKKAGVQISTETRAALEQHEAEFLRMEKRAGAVRNELAAWATSQQDRYAAIRAKRDAARKAEEPAPVSPRITTEESDDEEPANVVVLASVKSDALLRLEYHDKKLFEFVDRLLKATLQIKHLLKLRQAPSARFSDDQFQLLDNKLKASLTDYAALVAMRKRFESLKQSLQPEEKAELSEGIAESMERAEQAETQIFNLLNDATTRMKLVDALVEKKHEEKIIQFAKEKAEESGEDISSLPAQAIWAMGRAEFIVGTTLLERVL